MAQNLDVTTNSTLYSAQKKAIQLHLPLVVLCCITSLKQYDTFINTLLLIESMLLSNNIPLMITAGPQMQTILAVIHHTNPKAVYFDSISMYDDATAHLNTTKTAFYLVEPKLATPFKVQSHPYKWPGTVIQANAMQQHINDYFNNAIPKCD